MDTKQVWDVIEEARARAGEDAAAEDIAQQVVNLLTRSSPHEIISASRNLRELMADSYRVDLWHAAYLINGGCSDDGFEYFRGWLLTQGRAVFERAVADPDSLAELPAVVEAATDVYDLECEDMLRAAWTAYRAVSGDKLPREAFTVSYPSLTFDRDIEQKDEGRRRFPRLAGLVLD